MLDLWRYPCYDLRTSTFVGFLPAISSQWSDVLNDPGSWSATVLLNDDTYAMARDYTGRLLVVAERGGVPVNSGILWRSQIDLNARTIDLAGAGLMSFFDHFTILDAVTYTAQDQLTIFRALAALQITQSTAGDIGFQLEATLSGVPRDRTYEAYSGKTFYEMMSELSAVINGFDFAARVEYVAGVPQRWLRTWYPKRGQTQSVSGLRFSTPGRNSLGGISFDATQMAATVVASGSTPTAAVGDPIAQDTLRTTASRTDIVAAGWPGYSLVRTWPDVIVLTTLDEHAVAEVVRLSQVERESYTIDVDPNNLGMPFGSWDIGDEAMLVVGDGLATTLTLTLPRRVVGHTWTVGQSGESLAVTLAPITSAPYVPVDIRHAPAPVAVAPPAAPPTPVQQYPNESPALEHPNSPTSLNQPATTSTVAVRVPPSSSFSTAVRGG